MVGCRTGEGQHDLLAVRNYFTFGKFVTSLYEFVQSCSYVFCTICKHPSYYVYIRLGVDHVFFSKNHTYMNTKSPHHKTVCFPVRWCCAGPVDSGTGVWEQSISLFHHLLFLDLSPHLGCEEVILPSRTQSCCCPSNSEWAKSENHRILEVSSLQLLTFYNKSCWDLLIN